MPDPRSSYRIDIIDGPTRCGKLESDSGKVKLPILIDIENEGPGKIKVIFPERMDASFDRREGSDPHPIMVDHMMKGLSRIKADSMVGAVSAFSNRFFLMSGENFSEVPLTTDLLSRVITTDPFLLSDLLIAIKGNDPLHDPLYLPGTGGTLDLETLFYLGVEVFDTMKARSDGRNGIYYTERSSLDATELKNLGGASSICSCQACSGTGEDLSNLSISDHNVEMIGKRLKMAVFYLRKGSLREHVMATLAGKPEQMSILRKVEKGVGWDLGGCTPSFRRSDKVAVTYRDDLNAPDHSLWRQRIIEEFTPIPTKRLLLLLPCSARKPYSSSRTHRRIDNALNSVKGWKTICQRLVLTSPLGAVPMELESLYPAAHYDIPVTGDWHNEEIEHIRKLTGSVMKKGNFDKVICYHHDRDRFFPEAIGRSQLFGSEFVDVHGLADDEGIRPDEMLRRTISPELEGPMDLNRRENEVMEVLKAIEFSTGIEFEFTRDLNIKTSWRGSMLRSGKRDLFDLKIGGPVPTKEAGKIAWEVEGNGKRIMIDDFTPKGTLFSHGINEVKGIVRPGDIVLIGHDDTFKAVGRAMIPGSMMGTPIRGNGVKVLSYMK